MLIALKNNSGAGQAPLLLHKKADGGLRKQFKTAPVKPVAQTTTGITQDTATLNWSAKNRSQGFAVHY